MTALIPANAGPIIAARRDGFKPAELVIVSLIGRINEPNHTVYANDKREYDWRWVRDLAVCVFAAAGIKWRSALRAIAAQRPAYLALWDADRLQGAQVWLFPNPDDIDMPRNQWRWELDFLPWTDIENREFAWS